MPNPNIFFDQKDVHRNMTQIGVIGSSRTLTGSQLVTRASLAAKCRFAKFVISHAGNSETCRPPNIKTRNIKNDWNWFCDLAQVLLNKYRQSYSHLFILRVVCFFNFAGHLLKCLPPSIKFKNAKFRICCIFGHAKSKYVFRPKRRASKNDADWCDRFVQNSHGEPIGDKNDSCREMPFCEICNFAGG